MRGQHLADPFLHPQEVAHNYLYALVQDPHLKQHLQQAFSRREAEKGVVLER